MSSVKVHKESSIQKCFILKHFGPENMEDEACQPEGNEKYPYNRKKSKINVEHSKKPWVSYCSKL